MSAFINPFSDFGFKKIFGEEASKPVLIDFLNALLPLESHITDLTFKNSEQLSESAESRKVVFDIYCENEKGEKFIVELQKARQNFFKERTIYYSTFPIREQVERNDYKYNLKAIYCIGILDFAFKDYGEDEDKKRVVHEIKLKNQSGKVFYDKLTYIYLEMPNFLKKESELETHLDKWLYFIKNLNNLNDIPLIFTKDVVFMEAFNKAKLSGLSQDEYASYINSIKGYNDWMSVMDTKLEEAELRIKRDLAKSLKSNGVALEIIQKTTRLSIDEIQDL